LDIPADGAAIVGENAQGKTNLLEAIYYLETFRSFRGSRDDRLVTFGQEVFRILGRLACGKSKENLEVTAAFQVRGRRKKVTVDGLEPQRLGEGLGNLAAVIFSPGDVGLVSEGPGARRRFLDIVLSLNVPGYLRDLQRFRQALGQRNGALKNGMGRDAVGAWDLGLVSHGARIVAERRRWVDRWREGFEAYFRRISGHQCGAMAYQPGLRLEEAREVEDIAAAFLEALGRSREREHRLGSTLVGPHRDELLLTVEEAGVRRDLREYGSGGQRRTAALALRLAEAATIRESREREPIVLLDDVFAELDPGRSERILALMEEEETGQVILTAPKDSDIRLRRDSLPRWRIRNGFVER
jgi:DNA replication and repair protein RecF